MHLVIILLEKGLKKSQKIPNSMQKGKNMKLVNLKRLFKTNIFNYSRVRKNNKGIKTTLQNKKRKIGLLLSNGLLNLKSLLKKC